MKPGSFIFTALLLINASVIAQDNTSQKEKNQQPIAKRIFWAGNMGFWYGSSPYGGSLLYLEFSPGIGISLSEFWRAGSIFAFQYISSQLFYTLAYGPIAFVQYELIPDNLVLHSEFEILRYRIKWSDMPAIKLWVPAWLIGGGIIVRSGNLLTQLLVLYDLLQHPNSPYAYTNYLVLRVGFSIIP